MRLPLLLQLGQEGRPLILAKLAQNPRDLSLAFVDEVLVHEPGLLVQAKVLCSAVELLKEYATFSSAKTAWIDL